MKNRDLIFAIVCLVVILGLVYLSVTGKYGKPTLLTVPAHQGITAETPRTRCLECHDTQTGTIDVSKRLPSNHPDKWKDEKFLCTRCHEVRRSIELK